MKLNRLLTATIAVAIAGSVCAQVYDDDIYFDASKAKKKTAVKKARVIEPASYPAADTYAGEFTTSTRDIDEYNRRGFFATPDTTATDSAKTAQAEANGDAFANTRRIERFYNPDVVAENPDATVAEYYYNGQPAEINIYVTNPYPFFGSAAMYYDPWYFGTSIYNPWYYGGFYNPWSWGWGPSWSWNWGPSWGWGLSWGWGPVWGPSWGWAPAPGPNRPPSTRPERPHGGNYAGSYRRAANASVSGGRFNAGTPTGGRREPGVSSGSNWNINNVGSAGRPGSSSSGYRRGATGNRGGSTLGTGNARRPSNARSTNNNSSRRNQDSYGTRSYDNNSRSNSGTTYRSNGGSTRMGGGSFRNGGSGGMGGGRSTGGGGGRRR